MSTSILDLWPDDIRVDVLTPQAVLRMQERLFEQKTKGILKAQVATTTTDEWVQHQLDLIAPSLHHYRVTILAAKHAKGQIYPVTVTARCFVPKNNPYSYQPPQIPIAAIVAGFEILDPNQKVASTTDEFIDLVREVLRSGETRGLIQSLIARSNEERISSTSPDQTKPKSDGAPSEENGSTAK